MEINFDADNILLQLCINKNLAKIAILEFPIHMTVLPSFIEHWNECNPQLGWYLFFPSVLGMVVCYHARQLRT